MDCTICYPTTRSAALIIGLAALIAACSGDQGGSLTGPSEGGEGRAEPSSEEFLVASETLDPRGSGSVDVAQSSGGEFAATWAAPGPSGRDIYVRLYAADGTPRGEPFAIGAGEGATDPHVGMDAMGGFVIAWRTFPTSDAGGHIWFRRFTQQGDPLGDAQTVALLPGLFDSGYSGPGLIEGPERVSLAMSPDGEFVVTWLRWASAAVYPPIGGGGGTEVPLYRAVYARAYDADGSSKGLPILVSIGAGRRMPPVVAMNDDGGFVVSWRHSRASGENHLRFRRYDAQGRALARPQSVPGESPILFAPWSIGMDASGNFALAWGMDVGSQVQRFDADGEPVGAVFHPTSVSQENPRIAMAPTGDFAVTWTQDSDVYLRCYAPDATPKGEAFTINETPLPAEMSGRIGSAVPALAYDGYGRLLVAWHRYDTATFPEVPPEIRARLIAGC